MSPQYATANQLSEWIGRYVDITLINGTVVKSALIKSVNKVGGPESIESEVTYTTFQNGFPRDVSIQGTHILNIQQAAQIGGGTGSGTGGPGGTWGGGGLNPLLGGLVGGLIGGSIGGYPGYYPGTQPGAYPGAYPGGYPGTYPGGTPYQPRGYIVWVPHFIQTN